MNHREYQRYQYGNQQVDEDYVGHHPGDASSYLLSDHPCGYRRGTDPAEHERLQEHARHIALHKEEGGGAGEAYERLDYEQVQVPASELEVVRGSAAELQEQHHEYEYWLYGQDGLFQDGAGRMQGGYPVIYQIDGHAGYHGYNQRISPEKCSKTFHTCI